MTGCVGKRLQLNNLQPSRCSTCFYWCFFLPEPPVCVVKHGFTYSHLQDAFIHVIAVPASMKTWQRWNRILTCGLRTGDLLKVRPGCPDCSASVSFHHGNSSETQPDILPVHQQPWTGLTWLTAVSGGLPPIYLPFVIHWHCHSGFKFKNPFGKIFENSWFTFHLPSCVRSTTCLLANSEWLGCLLAVFLRWIQSAGSLKISTRRRRCSVILLLNGACHKQTWPWKKQLIDRWWDVLMTHVIPLGTGWQKDISGKLSLDGCSLQHRPPRQPASGWWCKWLMAAVSLLSAPPRQLCLVQLLSW